MASKAALTKLANKLGKETFIHEITSAVSTSIFIVRQE